jgi:hypothetical protein
MRPNEARYSVSKRREEGEAKKGGKEGHGADTAREREKVKERRDGFIPEVDADDGGDGEKKLVSDYSGRMEGPGEQRRWEGKGKRKYQRLVSPPSVARRVGPTHVPSPTTVAWQDVGVRVQYVQLAKLCCFNALPWG